MRSKPLLPVQVKKPRSFLRVIFIRLILLTWIPKVMDYLISSTGCIPILSMHISRWRRVKDRNWRMWRTTFYSQTVLEAPLLTADKCNNLSKQLRRKSRNFGVYLLEGDSCFRRNDGNLSERNETLCVSFLSDP